MIPEGWQEKRIHELGLVQAGRQRSPHFTKGKLRPYLRVANVFDGFIDTSSVFEMYFTDEEYEIYSLQPGDILLNEGQSLGLVGRPAMYCGNPSNCCFQNTLIRFRANSTVDAKFMLNLFRHFMYSGYFASIATQTTSVAHLGVSRFANILAVIPPLAEQRRIAEILGTWDAAIATVEQLIAALRERKRGLMQRLLTGEVRFPGFEGEWEEVRLGDVAKMQSGGTPSTQNSDYWNGSIPWITGADVNENLQLNEIRRYISENAVENSATTIISKGDIVLVSRTGVGKIAMAPFDIAVSQDITGLSLKTNKVDIRYLLYSLSWNLPQLIRFNQGTSINGVIRKDLERQILKLPPKLEQEQITSVLNCIISQIEELTAYDEQLKQQKKGLMQRLLTGQVRASGS